MSMINVNDQTVILEHGSGGKLYHQLIEQVFMPAFGNRYLDGTQDAAVCEGDGGPLALTTDSFVVQPRFFCGGDIGRLAVCGTVNDIVTSGAEPKYLTLGMILEHGLPLAQLRRICESIATAATEAGVYIVSGDTKVVEAGACDGIFINTAGCGLFGGRRPLAGKVQAGDSIICTGSLGDHGLALLAAREELGFDPPLTSDVAPLNGLIRRLEPLYDAIHALRDPTRGGAAATLNEWAEAAQLAICLDESSIPVRPQTGAAAQLLGMDLLYAANEGKMLIALAPEAAEQALELLHGHPLGRMAALIGTVSEQPRGRVWAENAYGGQRIIDPPAGLQLPRIC
ncbi:MAG: hydrogenase expression/formation protein HypE [Bacillota bacterium]|nr:hydrogenase expression/formation protein HypE [Bacillota bacterium]